ncbi:hypothetical protein [Bacillus paralicheniformis]|uniref:hypothetical protein n=1 Tax=Bacillus paralicheniformis TaxID=1648923 RepID=UPI002281E067|nr:hypothetical protein [Bacillus paralicheniformis]MCY9420054.1 hypothetical protein [Bacillus paralicheniformis]
MSSGDFIGELEGILSGDLRQDLSFIAKAYLKENLEKGTVFLLYFNDAVQDKEVCELIMDIPRRLNRFLETYFANLYAEKKISGGNFQILSQMFFGLLNQYIMFQHLPAFKESFDDRIDDYVEECVDLFYKKLEKEVPS